VLRIDDERAASIFRELAATLVPELVVRQHAAVLARGVAGARLAFFRIEQIAVLPRVLVLLEAGRFFAGERGLAGERVGTLERRDRAEGIGAGQIARVAHRSWSLRQRGACREEKPDGQRGL